MSLLNSQANNYPLEKRKNKICNERKRGLISLSLFVVCLQRHPSLFPLVFELRDEINWNARDSTRLSFFSDFVSFNFLMFISRYGFIFIFVGRGEGDYTVKVKPAMELWFFNFWFAWLARKKIKIYIIKVGIRALKVQGEVWDLSFGALIISPFLKALPQFPKSPRAAYWHRLRP